MADNKDQIHDGVPGEFSDETIRRFLLGGLSASEQPLFEQRLFTEDGLDARVRLAEFDLADDYALERLSAPERNLFEERFLLTSDRRQKLQVSKVLRDRFSPINATAKRSEKKTVADSLKDLFGFGRPVWRFAFGVLILVILLGTAWLVVKEPRLARQIANRINPRRSAPANAPREVNHPANTSTPEHQTTPSPMREHDQTASSLIAASIMLIPEVSPDSSKMLSVNLPKGEREIVRLQLVLKPDQSGSYRAELVAIEGSSVFSADTLKTNDSHAGIDFDVPARLLKTGNYQVRLSRVDRGSKGIVASYYFRVQ